MVFRSAIITAFAFLSAGLYLYLMLLIFLMMESLFALVENRIVLSVLTGR